MPSTARVAAASGRRSQTARRTAPSPVASSGTSHGGDARRVEQDPLAVAGDERVADLVRGAPGGELLLDLAPDLGGGLGRRVGG